MHFLVINPDGSRVVRGHPGWLIGDAPDASRPLTADELVDAGFGLKLIDEPPAYSPTTQSRTQGPIADWPVAERTATVVYTVTDLTPDEILERTPTITPRQLRLTLLYIGITEAEVDAALVNDPAGQIEWKYATYFNRTHPLVDRLGLGFSITPEQIDSLWAYALDF